MSDQNSSSTPYEPPNSGPDYEPPAGAYPSPVQSGRNNTQLFGVLGIVLAVACCPLLGILFGWLSINEARKTGSDETLGKVGFWIGIALTALGVIGAIIAICAGGIGGWNNYRY
jgi:hypothetical protein